MAIMGNDGISYSFDSDKLIEELKQDIAEFGDIEFYAWYKIVAGVKLYTNYDFPDSDVPVDFSKEVKPGEDIEVIQGKELLEYLIKQNKAV